MGDKRLRQLVDEVRRNVRDEGFDDAELSNALTVEILDAAGQWREAHRRIDDDLLNADVAYALPDEHLKLGLSYVKAAVACFTGGPKTAIAELVGLLLRYERLKIKLSAEEAAVLRVLKKANADGLGALSPAAIGDRLATDHAVLRDPRPLLQQLKLKNRDKTKLVEETVPGMWAVGNV